MAIFVEFVYVLHFESTRVNIIKKYKSTNKYLEIVKFILCREFS